MCSRKLVLIAAFFIPAYVAEAQAPSPAGKWRGAVEMPGKSLGIQVNIATTDSLRATIDIAEQGVSGFVLKIKRIGDDSLGFSMPDVDGEPTFRARFQADSLWGVLVQAGQSFPFKLRRASNPSLDSSR